jgi:hypothetical protein
LNEGELCEFGERCYEEGAKNEGHSDKYKQEQWLFVVCAGSYLSEKEVGAHKVEGNVNAIGNSTDDCALQPTFFGEYRLRRFVWRPTGHDGPSK